MDISSVKELVEAKGYTETIAGYLEKIERTEPKVNAFITVANENAMRRAEQLDRQKGTEDLPLAGIPIAIKDNISTKGIETTCASNILKGYIPPFSATVIERLKAAGAIIVGKTNMDEFGMGTTCEHSIIGPTKNPHDSTRVTGGSSGGSAAAVASNEVPIALGSDTGGSIRCPASFCGCVGLKPTYGAVSRYGLIAYANSLEQIGPLATTVRDTALLFNIIRGGDERDSTSVSTSHVPTKTNTPKVVGIPAGILSESREEKYGEVESKVVDALKDSLDRFEDAGIKWKEVELFSMRHALAAYYIIAMCEASSNLARFDGMRYGLRTEDTTWDDTFARVRGEGFGDEVKRRVVLGTFALSEGYHEKYYLRALKVRTLVKESFEHAFSGAAGVDAIVMPSMPSEAFKIGEMTDPLKMYAADVFTCPVNLAGLPSISVPSPVKGRKGLPLGVQLIGAPFHEETLFSLASAGGWE